MTLLGAIGLGAIIFGVYLVAQVIDARNTKRYENRK